LEDARAKTPSTPSGITKRVRRLRIAVVGIAAGALAVAGIVIACGPGNIGDLTSGRLAAAADATPDVDAEVCPHVVPPDPPSGGDGASLPTLIFAAEDLRADTGEKDAGLPKPDSLDLDRTCTCLEPPSCVAPPDAGAALCEPDGRDNVAGAMLGTLSTILPVIEPAAFTKRIREGVYTMLLSLQSWNGQPNDPSVVVGVRVSVGLSRPEAGEVLPKFDGNDVWDVDPGSLVQGDALAGKRCDEVGCVAIASDVKAYVRDGQLVAHFDRVPLALSMGSGRLNIPFIGGVLLARITNDGNGYRVSGEVAGRWTTADILASAYAIRDPVTNKSLCANPEGYAFFKDGVCSAADLAATPAQDRTGAPCAALSEAVRFVASPAKLGIVRQVTQEPSDCPPVMDKCP
jgi:hypothetical protein